MKKSKTIPLLGILSLVTIITLFPPAFANTSIAITSGSGISAMCSMHLTCYNPDTVTIQQGETAKTSEMLSDQDFCGDHMCYERSLTPSY